MSFSEIRPSVFSGEVIDFMIVYMYIAQRARANYAGVGDKICIVAKRFATLIINCKFQP